MYVGCTWDLCARAPRAPRARRGRGCGRILA